MTTKRTSQNSTHLRQKAEVQLARAPKTKLEPRPAEELLHELQVHQIELEMQNEQLRQTQLEMEKLRDRYVDLYEFAPVGYLTLTDKGMLSGINLTGAAQLNVERNRMLHYRFALFIVAEDRDRWDRHFLDVLTCDGTLTIELALQHGDGPRIYARLDCSCMKNDDNELLVRIVLTDITKRKQAEDKLAASEQHFRAITKSANDAIITATGAGNIMGWNAAAERLFGYTEAEIIGQPLTILMPERFRRLHGEGLNWVAANGAPHTIGKTVELAGLRKDGSEFPLELSQAQWQAADGQFFAAIIRDITERKKMEKQAIEHYEHVAKINTSLAAANQQLQHAQNQLLQSEKLAAIGNLAAGVAHEINNPISYVNSNMGALEKYLADIFTVIDKYEAAETLLDQDNPLLEDMRQFKNKIDIGYIREDIKALISESHHGLERVKKIVLDLKNFSRVDTEEHWEHADLHKDMDATLNVVWNELKYKCEVVKEYGSLPEIYCLPAQLGQVFLNLLLNAAQAIETRGKITIRTGQEDGKVWVEVSDTGKGIPPEHIPRLFEPFFTTKPVGQGTGLGLSVSYNIVENHHGKIEVHSEVGKGSTFRVWLPVQQPVSEGAA